METTKKGGGSAKIEGHELAIVSTTKSRWAFKRDGGGRIKRGHLGLPSGRTISTVLLQERKEELW